MNSSRASLMLLAICLLAAPALAAGIATRDTTFLLGGPDRWDGEFETPAGEADWHGWTSPFGDGPRWHISSYNVPAGGGQYAMWSGTTFANACAEGYGNGWFDQLVFTYQVPNPAVATTVRMQCVFNSHSEPGYDFLSFQMNRGSVWQDIAGPFDDVHTNATVDVTVTFQPADYIGQLTAQLQLRVLASSDGIGSDEDCSYDSQGLAQVDNIRVTVTGGPTFWEDFEDQVSDHWIPQPGPTGTWPSLNRDLPEQDPDQDNPSWQVNWRGWIDPPEGVDAHFQGMVCSPPLAVPAGMTQLIYAFDICVNDQWPAPGNIFYLWHVRSTAASDSMALLTVPWEDRNFIYHGSLGYHPREEVVGDLLVPDARWVQVSFETLEYGWVWGVEDDSISEDLPYFDNVAVKAVLSGTVDVPDASQLSVTAYPNPFNPWTTIALDLPQAGLVELAVFDLRGRRVRTLNEGDLAAGHHEIIWDGHNDAGGGVAAGTYVYRLEAAGRHLTGRLTLVR